MKQIDFTENVKGIIKNDAFIIGLAVSGSWLTKEMDEFSDLDLILVTREKIGGNTARMMEYAKRFNGFLSGFTGEHIGETRLLICLYSDPLLHVDIKFLTLDEFTSITETPTILLDTNEQLKNAGAAPKAPLTYPDYQWIEDRFWTWVHYTLLKIGRGEYMEAFDTFSFLRSIVLGPLLYLKNGNKPRGVRKVEIRLPKEDVEALKSTLPAYERASLLQSLRNVIQLYKNLRSILFKNTVTLQQHVEQKVMQYFDEIENR